MKTASLFAALSALVLLAPARASDTQSEEPLPGEVAPAAPKTERLPLQPYEKLLALLPPVPEGWKAEKADGSLTDTDELRLSTAERTYYRENPKDEDNLASATVTIIDSSSNSEFFDSDEAKWENSTETDEGYDRRLVIDGMRAVEHYDKKAKTGSLSVFVAQRYFVQIELTNLDPKELATWLKKVDIRGLSELK